MRYDYNFNKPSRIKWAFYPPGQGGAFSVSRKKGPAGAVSCLRVLWELAVL